MGKGEYRSAEDSADEETTSNEETTEENKKEEDGEENTKSSDEKTLKTEEKAEESEDTKKGEDDIRKIIKFDSAEVEEEKNKAPEQNEPIEDDAPTTSRETLEQKRAILQSIKDFDFLIKKNQEDITELNQKFESVSKDLDDLVSLYEIVSEQMNPFVGLSKVTKKRIDALENFTKEIDNLKERTGELESFAERSGAKLKKFEDIEDKPVETIDTDAILGEEGFGEELSDDETPELQTPSPIDNNILRELSDDDLDKILERALGTISSEDTIDMLIDEFIENLKG